MSNPFESAVAPAAALAGAVAESGAPAAVRLLRVAPRAPDPAAPPALDAISAADLRRDLFFLAGETLRGRETGTQDELRAALWLAERARAEGLEPAGDDGTYLQLFPIRRLRQSEDSVVEIGGRALELGRDAVTFGPVRRRIRRAELLYVPPDVVPERAAVRGRFVATLARPPAETDPPGISLAGLRYAVRSIAERSQELLRLGAAGVVIASDPLVEPCFEDAGTAVLRGRYGIDQGVGTFRPDPAPVIWVRAAVAELLQRPGAVLSADLQTDSFVHPSANVIARVPGTDRALAHEHLMISGHLDHDGVRLRAGEASLRCGADDNGSMSVALLAIGRAWRRAPARRSALFVWHGAEERGLLGSSWLSAHPPVPLRDLIAVLNGDMIGRNAPSHAALLGAEAPNRNSSALVEAALAANRRVGRFLIDSSWDRPDHPEHFYVRSDHLPYARAGVPAVFFTTQLHPDYHQPTDSPERIDYRKLARMTRWIYATAWRVANTEERPALDG